MTTQKKTCCETQIFRTLSWDLAADYCVADWCLVVVLRKDLLLVVAIFYRESTIPT